MELITRLEHTNVVSPQDVSHFAGAAAARAIIWGEGPGDREQPENVTDELGRILNPNYYSLITLDLLNQELTILVITFPDIHHGCEHDKTVPDRIIATAINALAQYTHPAAGNGMHHHSILNPRYRTTTWNESEKGGLIGFNPRTFGPLLESILSDGNSRHKPSIPGLGANAKKTKHVLRVFYASLYSEAPAQSQLTLDRAS